MRNEFGVGCCWYIATVNTWFLPCKCSVYISSPSAWCLLCDRQDHILFTWQTIEAFDVADCWKFSLAHTHTHTEVVICRCFMLTDWSVDLCVCRLVPVSAPRQPGVWGPCEDHHLVLPGRIIARRLLVLQGQAHPQWAAGERGWSSSSCHPTESAWVFQLLPVSFMQPFLFFFFF